MTGKLTLQDALEDGSLAGVKALKTLRFKALTPIFAVENPIQEDGIHPLCEFSSHKHGKAFIDVQHDVTASDVRPRVGVLSRAIGGI